MSGGLLGEPRSPVAVGGVGGSGTRVVAELLERSGRHLGEDLNAARDNLWFTLLFKHRQVLDWDDTTFGVAVAALRDRTAGGTVRLDAPLERLLDEVTARGCEQHEPDWLAQRRRSLERPGRGAAGRPWGWKEPNTHVVLDRLDRHLDGLRYVHVARSGLDMALSANQNQARLWGPVLGVGDASTPAGSLRVWRAAHERVLAIGERMGDRFLFLRYEDLCAQPVPTIARLLRFAGHDDPTGAAVRLAPAIRPATGIGRARDAEPFDPDDVAYVAGLGFAVPA